MVGKTPGNCGRPTDVGGDEDIEGDFKLTRVGRTAPLRGKVKEEMARQRQRTAVVLKEYDARFGNRFAENKKSSLDSMDGGNTQLAQPRRRRRRSSLDSVHRSEDLKPNVMFLDRVLADWGKRQSED